MEECINLVKSEFISLLSDDKERLFVVSLSLKLKKITGSVGIKQYVRLFIKQRTSVYKPSTKSTAEKSSTNSLAESPARVALYGVTVNI